MSAKDEELVLALPRERVFGPRGIYGPRPWHGLRRGEVGPLLELSAREGHFRRRGDLEPDPTWKQLIPYLVLRDGPRVFLMRRTRGGGDPRLHDRWTIGIGGHVNERDGDLLAGLAREWSEELTAGFTPTFEPLGLLNDDQDPVGAVHLGIVYQADAGGRPVGVREVEALEGGFASLAEVHRVRPGLETWSRFLLDALDA